MLGPLTFLIVALDVLVAAHLVRLHLKNRKIRKSFEEKERNDSEEDGFGRLSYGDRPHWIYDGGITIRPVKGLILGRIDANKEEIKINLGSILKSAENEEKAIFHLDEVVLHELTHWADEHNEKSEDRHTGKGHSERYHEVLQPLVNPEMDGYNPHEN